MPLPELRCKQDHVPKSVIQILFNSKCEVQRDGNRKEGWGRGEKERERDQAEERTLVSSVLLVFVHPGLLHAGRGPGLFFCRSHLSPVQVPQGTDAIPITWGDMCMSSCLLSHSLPHGNFCLDALAQLVRAGC